MKEKITASGGNVFADLGFEAGKALSHRVRSDLMAVIHRIIESTTATQDEAARLFGVSQPRISDLVRGQIEKFSTDGLVEMLGRAGFDLELSVSKQKDESPFVREIEVGSDEFEFTVTGWRSPLESVRATATGSRDAGSRDVEDFMGVGA